MLWILAPFAVALVAYVLFRTTDKKEETPQMPCRRHYFSTDSFTDCDVCKWSSTFEKK